jgi:hypothetical protein
MGPAHQAVLDVIEQRLGKTEESIESLKSQIDLLIQTHEPGWNLVTRNVFDLTNILRNFRSEGGFLGQKNFNENPLGDKDKLFEDLAYRSENFEKKIISLDKEKESEKAEFARQIDCLSKAVT